MGRWGRVGLALSVIILLLCGGCGEKQVQVQEFSRENFLMDTLVKMTVYVSEPQVAQKALDEAFAEFHRIDRLADKFTENSPPDGEAGDVGRINRNAGLEPVRVSEDILTMLQRSNNIAGLSGGAFDISIGPVADLWGFKEAEHRLPEETALREKLALVDYRRIEVDEEEKTVFLPEKGMGLDLGGIAKGYATDMAAQTLRQHGIASAMINAGGNVYALGSKPDGSRWRVGIQDPRDSQKIIAILNVENTAVVSSGDYERYFTIDSVRYHHILDPVTGTPARKMMSTTVVTASAADADILSTALFVLGSEQGAQLAARLSGVQAVFVDADSKVTFSEELRGQIEFLDLENYPLKK